MENFTLIYKFILKKLYFLPNDFRGYMNMQIVTVEVCSLSNMKKIRKTGSFIRKIEDKVSNSVLNALLGSVLIVYESVDMKDNVAVITKVLM
jgi:hypothetical protein